MKECDKRKSHISNKLHMIYVSSNNVRHTVTKTFITLHFTKVYSLRQSANLGSSSYRNEQNIKTLN
jgi:porphobilinogen deaminase